MCTGAEDTDNKRAQAKGEEEVGVVVAAGAMVIATCVAGLTGAASVAALLAVVMGIMLMADMVKETPVAQSVVTATRSVWEAVEQVREAVLTTGERNATECLARARQAVSEAKSRNTIRPENLETASEEGEALGVEARENQQIAVAVQAAVDTVIDSVVLLAHGGRK